MKKNKTAKHALAGMMNCRFAISFSVSLLLPHAFVSAAVMYFLEQGTWDGDRKCHRRVSKYTKDFVDEGCSPFDSIPAGLWWGFATATTVGYGDDFPITVMGKIFSIFAMVLGVISMALPFGMVSEAFTEGVNQARE